jgi:hypothetical protein
MAKFIIALLFIFAYIPNLQIYYENFIVHDFLAVFILLLLIVKNRFLLTKIYAIITFLSIFIIILLFSFEKGSSWLILGRAWVYFSIPILLKEAFKIKNYEIFDLINKKAILISKISFLIILLFLIIHFLQFIGYLSNPFQMDYYIRALGVPMDEEYYRYAWFDEHHVAAPALLSLILLFSKKPSLLIAWLVAFINGSRMILAGSFVAIFFMYSLRYKILISIFSLILFAFVMNYTDYIDNFHDLQLRLINWGVHLSFMNSWQDIFFGYGSPNSSLDKIPIDNFIVRYFCNLGVVGMMVPIMMLAYIFRGSLLKQKFFVSIYLGAAIFNDLFAYPPSFAVFSGAVSLMFFSDYSSSQSITLKNKG